MDGSGREEVWSGELPSALLLDSGDLFILDSGSRRVLKCPDYAASACEVFAQLPPSTGFLFDFVILDDHVMYSDWGEAAVLSYDVTTEETQTIFGDLQRPTRFYVSTFEKRQDVTTIGQIFFFWLLFIFHSKS